MVQVMLQILAILVILGPPIGLALRAMVKSQNTINDEHKSLRLELNEERKARMEQALQFAEVKGGLETKVQEMKLELRYERTRAEERGQASNERIAMLAQSVEILQGEVDNLKERLQVVNAEKEQALVQLKKKEQELEEANKLLEAVRKELHEATRVVNKLMQEVAELRSAIEAKEREAAEIRLRLQGSGEIPAPG